jgi:hypothetical protein
MGNGEKMRTIRAKGDKKSGELRQKDKGHA